MPHVRGSVWGGRWKGCLFPVTYPYLRHDIIYECLFAHYQVASLLQFHYPSFLADLTLDLVLQQHLLILGLSGRGWERRALVPVSPGALLLLLLELEVLMSLDLEATSHTTFQQEVSFRKRD